MFSIELNQETTIEPIESLDTKKQLLHDPFNFNAWKLHEQRIAQLYTRACNQQRAGRIRKDHNR